MQQTATLGARHQVATVAPTRLRHLPTSNVFRIECRILRRDVMNRKTSALMVIALACSVLAATPTNAQVVEMATGIAGGLVDGVLYGVGLAANSVASLPADDARQMLPQSGRMYAEEQPNCRIRRVRAWDGYGWYFRSMQVCG
jgi:hypothetical protein